MNTIRLNRSDLKLLPRDVPELGCPHDGFIAPARAVKEFIIGAAEEHEGDDRHDRNSGHPHLLILAKNTEGTCHDSGIPL